MDQNRVTHLRELASQMAQTATQDGFFELGVPGAAIVRRAKADADPVHLVQEPCLCIVAEGEKRLALGKEVYVYNEDRLILCSVDVPVSAQITRASPAEPFLALRMALDSMKIAELALRVYPEGLPGFTERRALYVTDADDQLLQASRRLIEYSTNPEARRFLAPLVVDELLIRLLLGPAGPWLAQLGLAHSAVVGVTRAVNWLRENYSEQLNIRRLAALAHMSVSSFYQHFRSVTSLSPLQFQKVLRLQEARHLMLSRNMDAGQAGFTVGYATASQFSREYSRFYGNAPTRDIESLRERFARVAQA